MNGMTRLAVDEKNSEVQFIMMVSQPYVIQIRTR
jgi:hypothetical protein